MYSDLKKERRTWIDIVCEILTLCDKEQTKTSIVYKCNLNFKLIHKYLDVLTLSGFLEEMGDEEHITYRSTNRGREIGNEIIKLKQNVSFHRTPILLGTSDVQQLSVMA